MRYFLMKSQDIRMNLATEEYLMNNVDITEPTLLLYIQKPCVIIGRNQNVYEEVHLSYLHEQQIELTRRTSGGGAVYDDLGNLSFSIISKKDQQDFGDYHAAVRPIINALRTMGAEAITIHGRNDLYIDGKKFSGNAMYTRNGRSYTHGTLMYDVDLTTLTKVLRVPKEKIESKATKSVRNSVTNIKQYLKAEFQKATTEAFRDALVCQIFQVSRLSEVLDKAIRLTAHDQQAIKALFESRYANPKWIFAEAPIYQMHKRERIAGVGIVEISFSVEKGHISEMNIGGDFFGLRDIEALEAALLTVDYQKTALAEVLDQIKVSDYIHQLTNQDFLRLLIS